MKFDVIIPARFASTRLPGKALVDIAGLPMIQHVYQRAKQSSAERVIIATDDERIVKVAQNFGAEVCMTATHHESGTERIAEVANLLNYADDAIIVNVQGDSPLIAPDAIDQVAQILIKNPAANMATLCSPIYTKAELFNPNLAKVVMDKNNRVLYFSRAPIAWERDTFMQDNDVLAGSHYCHMGIYAYRVALLRQYINWKASPYEQLESLEQLRVLWHGEKIYIDVTQTTSNEVNTPEDLEHVRKLFVTM